jgi:hypothetical protein
MGQVPGRNQSWPDASIVSIMLRRNALRRQTRPSRRRAEPSSETVAMICLAYLGGDLVSHGALARDVVSQDAGLQLQLHQALLHDVADGNHSNRPAPVDCHEVSQPLTGHALHHFRDVILYAAHRRAPHHMADVKVAHVARVMVQATDNVALAEESRQRAIVIDDNDTADAAIEQNADCCADRIVLADRDDIACLPL